MIVISFSGCSQSREEKSLFVEEESDREKSKSNTAGVTHSSVEAH